MTAAASSSSVTCLTRQGHLLSSHGFHSLINRSLHRHWWYLSFVSLCNFDPSFNIVIEVTALLYQYANINQVFLGYISVIRLNLLTKWIILIFVYNYNEKAYAVIIFSLTVCFSVAMVNKVSYIIFQKYFTFLIRYTSLPTFVSVSLIFRYVQLIVNENSTESTDVRSERGQRMWRRRYRNTDDQQLWLCLYRTMADRFQSCGVVVS